MILQFISSLFKRFTALAVYSAAGVLIRQNKKLYKNVQGKKQCRYLTTLSAAVAETQMFDGKYPDKQSNNEIRDEAQNAVKI